MKPQLRLTAFCQILSAALGLSSYAQGTAFTYQGRLTDGPGTASGSYDLRFIVFDNSAGGNQQGPILTNTATLVSNGLFTVTLDFGNQFPGANRWIEIGVRSGSGAAFTTLTPRQALTPAPYAITAGNISGVVPPSSLGGIYNGALTLNNPVNIFLGDGSGLTGVKAATLGGFGAASFWNTAGNANTSPASNFLGTTDNQPLEFRVNNQRCFRIEPNGTTETVNVIGGASCNFVRPDVVGATIGGGGSGNFLGIVYSNLVESLFGTISGGAKNTINGNSFVSTIGGGFQNTIGGNSPYGTIGGGAENTIKVGASYATIPGGYQNRAADSAFAAGSHAKADHQGAFVWADSTAADFISSAANQFLIRASGGVGIGLTNPASPLHVSSAGSNPQARLTQSTPGDYARLLMNVAGSASWEMDVSSGATPTISWWNIAQRMTLDYNGNLFTAGTVTAAGVLLTSDRAAKENFTVVDGQAVLAKLVALPITEWNYKHDSSAIRHLGPMAKDFKSAFQLDGADDKHISVVDEGGVALAAIQGLNHKLEEMREENIELKHQLAEIKNSLQQLGHQPEIQP